MLFTLFSTRSNVSEKSYSSLSTAGGISRVNNQDTEYYGIPFNIRNRSSEGSGGPGSGTYASLPASIAEERTESEIIKLRQG